MPNPTPRIAVLGGLVSSHSGATLDCFADLDSLLAAPSFDVLLLDQPAAIASRALRTLRAESPYRFQLIYCCRELDDTCIALSDGPAPADLDELTVRWQLWQSRFARFEQSPARERFESRVLSWLWMRASAQVLAVRDPQVAQHYRYPLLEALAGEELVSSFAWLGLMVQQDWLEEGEMLDRIRLCGECGSGRLNFVDVCPECQALSISRQPSLHCFTCGHVAPQDAFLKNAMLLCPNCLKQLRHIGSDYDRPLENYCCRGCQAFFVDAAVQARCMDCGLAHAPDRLRVREIRHYRLTEAGRLRCRQGLDGQAGDISHFSRLNLLGGRTFYDLLNWQLQIARRYTPSTFSVLGLRFVNLDETVTRLGEHRGHAFVDSLVARLQEVLRETDRCSRSTEEILWVMLPQTGAGGLNTVKQRLGQVAELFTAPEVSSISLRISSLTAPHDLHGDENAELLLARVASELT
ncbi:diguanylate cyclase domain-containing protein [Pseudomonas sp. Irchel 3F5]|uniref:TackOD1 domain-containing metal-binding protein n=1 Tax=Pseudomonas sp. Irchel 3F5 TaxID=2009002 RepID=UPI000BA45198|nr:diguanylate cyclase [Pseudomonas sp. Irchel 3F5]